MNATDTLKAIPIAAPGEGTIATRVAAGLGLRPTLLDEWHFLRFLSSGDTIPNSEKLSMVSPELPSPTALWAAELAASPFSV